VTSTGQLGQQLFGSLYFIDLMHVGKSVHALQLGDDTYLFWSGRSLFTKPQYEDPKVRFVLRRTQAEETEAQNTGFADQYFHVCVP